MDKIISFVQNHKKPLAIGAGAVVLVLVLLLSTGLLGKLTSTITKNEPAKERTPAGNEKTGHELTDKKNDAETYMSLVCDGQGFAAAEAHNTGEKPYHYALVGAGNPTGWGGVSAGPFMDDVKLLWDKPEKMQLVGCLSRFNEKDTGLVCNYEIGPPTKLFKTEYRLDIYETKTAKHLKTANLPDVGEAACPPKGSGQAASSPGTEKVFTGVKNGAVYEAMKSFIE